MTRSRRTVAALCALVCGACHSEPLRETDRPFLITVEDLVDYGAKIDEEGASRVEQRVRYLDGSRDLQYDFESAEGVASPLFLSTTVGFERNKREAASTYALLRGSLKVGASLGDVEVKELTDFFSYGDATFFALLEAEGRPIGNLMVLRSDTMTYSVVLSGFYFDDAEEWASLIRPKLDALERDRVSRE